MGISRRKKRFNISNLKPYQTSPKINKGIKNDLIDLQSTDNFIHKLDFSHVSHIKELIIATAEKPHIAKRLISTFAFCLLRMNNIKYKKTSEILESIGCCEISVASNLTGRINYVVIPISLYYLLKQTENTMVTIFIKYTLKLKLKL